VRTASSYVLYSFSLHPFSPANSGYRLVVLNIIIVDLLGNADFIGGDQKLVRKVASEGRHVAEEKLTGYSLRYCLTALDHQAFAVKR
jgi:hypothetical protein